MDEAKAAVCANDPQTELGDSGTERERRRYHLRVGAPFLRQRRFEWVLKEVAEREDLDPFRNQAVTLTTRSMSDNNVGSQARVDFWRRKPAKARRTRSRTC